MREEAAEREAFEHRIVEKQRGVRERRRECRSCCHVWRGGEEAGGAMWSLGLFDGWRLTVYKQVAQF